MESIDSWACEEAGRLQIFLDQETSAKVNTVQSLVRNRAAMRAMSVSVICQGIEAQLAHLPWIWQLRSPVPLNGMNQHHDWWFPMR